MTSMTQKSVSQGKKCFRGGCDLKASQHYPVGFGQAVRKIVLKNETAVKKNMKRLRVAARTSSAKLKGGDDWADAKLESVVDFLTN